MEKRPKKESKEKQVEQGVAEVGEDATKYGEFMSSYFSWVSLSKQKDRAEELEDITKNGEDNNGGKQDK